jgi:hypothetical protein
MAERRIVEMTRSGIVCFISNYSWLDGLSFTGMRERYLDVFDRIWIDSLNGDKYRTGKLTPDGEPDPSVFSTEWNREGIQVGTAVATLSRTSPHRGTRAVKFREFWGRAKREHILAALGSEPDHPYTDVMAEDQVGIPFLPRASAPDYLAWPSLPALIPISYPGVFTARDDVLVEIDREILLERMRAYFDPAIGHDEIRRRAPRALGGTARFDGPAIRDYLRRRGFLVDRVVRYAYRPFDVRWLYWEPETKLLDEKRPDYARSVVPGNLWFAAARQHRKSFDPPIVSTVAASLHVIERGANLFPLMTAPDPNAADLFATAESAKARPNLTPAAIDYVAATGTQHEHLFQHAIAILHAPEFKSENADALRQDWPRIPLPSDRVRLEASAALGRELAMLLDPEQPAPGVTTGAVRTELRPIGSPARTDGAQLDPDRDFSVTAGWGHAGKGGATMPGRGRSTERAYTDEERGMLETGAAEREMSSDQLYALLGETCYDVWLNDAAYWRCVPARVWEYTLGGYQVIKKWLSYRERPLLGRPLTLDEVREVRNIARRIAAILLLEPALNEAYAAVKADVWEWETSAAERQ